MHEYYTNNTRVIHESYKNQTMKTHDCNTQIIHEYIPTSIMVPMIKATKLKGKA